MPSKKKKYNARFPPARIKKIMQADEDVGKVAAAVPVIISRSLELFIDSLIERTATITRARNAKTLSTSHIKQAIYSEKTFDFLRDLVKSIPDHQVEDDGDGAVASGSGPQEKKPKSTKPRKPREEGARGRGRPRKIKPEPEIKKESSSEEDDEATESDEEQTSQEEMVISDQASNSPAYNPVQTSAQQNILPPHPLQSRIDSTQTSVSPIQNPVPVPQDTNAPPEHISGAHFPQPMMTQRPFHAPPFSMPNYPYTQYVMPPAAAPMGIPSHFMPPCPTMNTQQQQQPQMSPLPQGMIPFPQFAPSHPSFLGPSDGQTAGSNSIQPVPYGLPGIAVSQPVDQNPGLNRRQADATSQHDSNLPIDMSITGKSRQQSEGYVPDRPAPFPTIPVPQGICAPIPQGYSYQAQDQAQSTAHSEQSSRLVNAHSVTQPSTHIGNQPVENKAISNYTIAHRHKGSNSGSSVLQQNTHTADISKDTSVKQLETQEKDKTLVSFPGLSNIMKINSLKPVNNNEDDDYDT